MSLILTQISNAGIAMVADSAISFLNPKTGEIETHQKDWLKLLKVPRIHAAVSYWGNIGAVSRAQAFDEWLAERIKTNAYDDLPSLAHYLASELNSACQNKPLPNGNYVGVHVSGYHPWQDDVNRPMFFHVHNGDMHIAINYETANKGGQQVIIGISHKLVAKPRKLFEAHLDYPSANRSLADNVSGLDSGYITRNGDYFPYLLIADGLEFTRQTLRVAGVTLPRDPERLGSRLGYLSLIMQTVIGIYGRSSLAKIVGGHVTALGITPDARYVGETTRKSKFVSRRATQIGL